MLLFELYDGWNSTDINGDEFNGGGENWPVSPILFDSFESHRLILLQADDLVFGECPDLRVAPQPDTYKVPPEYEVLRIREVA